jgi:hypothetical protein
MTPNKSFLKKSISVSNNAESYADFKFVDADFKKFSEKGNGKQILSFEYFRFARLLPITFWHKILHF